MPTYNKTILFSVGIYLFKINNKNTRKWYELYLKLTKKRHKNNVSWHEHTVDVALVSFFLTLNIFCFLFYCFLCYLWTSKCGLGILLIPVDNHAIFKYCINNFCVCVESHISRCLAREVFCKFQNAIKICLELPSIKI